MSTIHEAAQSMRDAEILANTLGRSLDAILGVAFGAQVRTIHPAPVNTNAASPSAPGADLSPAPPAVNTPAAGGDFSGDET